MSRTYDDGVRAGIKEQLESDLVEYASRIEILEEELDRIRKAKWVSVVKHRLCETHEGPAHDLRHKLGILDRDNPISVSEKIRIIEDNANPVGPVRVGVLV